MASADHNEAMSVPDLTTKPTMTLVEAGALLALSRSASYHAAKSGAIPTLRVGSRLLVPTHKLRTMLGFPDGRESEPEEPVGPNASLDPILRDALVVVAAEAALHMMKHGKDA